MKKLLEELDKFLLMVFAHQEEPEEESSSSEMKQLKQQIKNKIKYVWYDDCLWRGSLYSWTMEYNNWQRYL